jgi:hypothetical protein
MLVVVRARGCGHSKAIHGPSWAVKRRTSLARALVQGNVLLLRGKLVVQRVAHPPCKRSRVLRGAAAATSGHDGRGMYRWSSGRGARKTRGRHDVGSIVRAQLARVVGRVVAMHGRGRARWRITQARRNHGLITIAISSSAARAARRRVEATAVAAKARTVGLVVQFQAAQQGVQTVAFGIGVWFVRLSKDLKSLTEMHTWHEPGRYCPPYEASRPPCLSSGSRLRIPWLVRPRFPWDPRAGGRMRWQLVRWKASASVAAWPYCS